MSIDWKTSNQSSDFMNSYFFYPFYDKLHVASKECRFIRLSAPFVGAIEGIGTLAEGSMAVGEAIIKGSKNLIQGTLTGDTESLETGKLQLLKAGFVGVFCFPIMLVERPLTVTIGMLKDPVETTSTEVRGRKIRHQLSQGVEFPQMPHWAKMMIKGFI